MTKVSGLGKNQCSVRVWGAFSSHCKTLPTEAGADGNSNVAVLKIGFHFFLYFLQLIVIGQRKKFKFACALGCYLANNVE